MEDWMLQVGQNKGTERNEMRNLLLNVIEVKRLKRDKEQAALMVYATPGQPFPHPTARCFFCDIRIPISKSNRNSSDQ